MTEQKLVKYYGIADAHGIETFLTEEQLKEDSLGAGGLMLRASLNRQRHAVFYMAEIDLMTEVLVKKYLDEGDFKTALEKIKSYSYRYGFPKDRKDEYQVSWDLIPNDKLDPYSDAGWDKSKQFPKEGEVAIGG